MKTAVGIKKEITKQQHQIQQKQKRQLKQDIQESE